MARPMAALALAAGKGARAAVQQVAEFEDLRGGVDALLISSFENLRIFKP